MTDYLSYTAAKNILSRIPSYLVKMTKDTNALCGIEEGVFYGHVKQQVWDLLIDPPTIEPGEKRSKDDIFHIETIKKIEKSTCC